MKKLHIVAAAAVFCLLSAAIIYVIGLYEKSLLGEAESSAQAQLSLRTLALQSVVDRNFNLMASLDAYVQNGFAGSTDQEINDYMRMLYESAGNSALNLYIAPHGVIDYLYPVQGNEQLYHWDLMNDPRQEVQSQLQLALHTRTMTVNGPFKLLQGNQGIVARKMVQRDGKFWGFIAVALDVDAILKQSGLAPGEKEHSELDMAIRAGSEPAFYGDDTIFRKHALVSWIDFPGHSWQVAGLMDPEALLRIRHQIGLLRAVSMLVLLLVFAIYFSIIYQRNRLQRVVESRTQELSVTNEKLMATNAQLMEGEEELRKQYALLGTYTTALRDSEKQLSYLAYHDALTGLANRNAFQQRLQDLLESGDRAQATVLLFDLDNFKMVNDTYGHQTGDMLLMEVVERIRAAELPIEELARFGGDEFAILLTRRTADDELRAFSERVLELFREPFHVVDKHFFISASIGIAPYPSAGTTREALLKNADIAMFSSKQEGGNRYTFFNASMESDSLAKLEMGNHLRQALERKEMEIHFQPQVDCKVGRIVGIEALLRWKHTSKGFISPATFIPLAEEMGLIIPLGEWVLREACARTKRWHEELGQELRISVNLSVRQLHDDKLIDKVRAILRETGLAPQFLEMEITENVAMKEEQLDTLRELREMGIAISVDDFGTKYSSLSYLKRFPVTKIKLDQSFVRGVQSDAKDRAMIKAIISVAESFELEIIAEGVETEEQAAFLVENGCVHIQGYYFFRPMPEAALLEVIGAGRQEKLARWSAPSGS
ncbi:EAL domain-containing protein [Paenibacillus athensensis]|uniref:Diguanylate cyclase n=1 Tax=Paenibacillus athensensis TaxID=1967502 RepID=A0A4Y8Q6D4_9BACL|nr:EAL domain-containing protein [Paenibacillus athensensis]MCD1259725.1 EAL domain-containing protein [Paenibacillus athensensis]